MAVTPSLSTQATPVASRHVSLTESVYASLRSELLACRLVPGQKLKIDELCRSMSSGSSAVREALSRLTSEGFVILTPQRGFRVAPLSIDDLLDLTRTRQQIEALCIRGAIAHGGVEWETQLVAALHRMSRTPEAEMGDIRRYSDAFDEAHTTFHQALVDACESSWLLKLRGIVFTQSERYRRLSRPLAKTGRNLDAEHRGIVEAALARDAERCVMLMDEHIGLTTRILIEAGAQEFEGPVHRARRPSNAK